MADKVPARSEKGKEIIQYAFQDDFTVLEFSVLDNGEFMVTDVTDHLRQLERMHMNNDPASPMDMRVPDNETESTH